MKDTKKNLMRLLVLIIIGLGISNASGAREYTPPQPGHTRSVILPVTGAAPVIDGKLDDEAWHDATVAKDFWVSLLSKQPSDKTEVLIQSDGINLYFGFRCYDSQPEGIDAIKTRRDAGLGFDDHVSVELDSYRNFRTISTYSVSANGTQNDAIAGGRARKIEWKGDWKGAAALTEYGWSAEIAIPYSILNYHADSSNFGINFVRYQHRTEETSHWADVTPQSKKEEMGQLKKLSLPKEAKKSAWTALPYVLAGVNIPNIKGDDREKLAYAGATIRYEPEPNSTAVVSLHPDFSQLETQVTDIDFSYTEKFRPDTRPFFQEGSFYLGNDNRYFYSNRVPDFYAGGKYFTQQGRTQGGGFVTTAPDERWDGTVRVVQELDRLHSTSLMLVGTSREDLDNQLVVAQFDGRERWGFFYNADVAYTNTDKLDTTDTGSAYLGTLGWRSNHWSMSVSADHYDEEYFPANALLNRDLFGTESVNASVGYYKEIGEGFFRRVSTNYSVTHRDTLDGRIQNYGTFVDGSVELNNPQVAISLSYYDADYRPLENNMRAEFSDILNDDYYWAVDLNFNTRSNYFGYGAYYSEGFLGGDDYEYVTGHVWVKPTINTFLNLFSERLDNFGIFAQTTVNAGWDITPWDGVVVRYIDAEEGGYYRLAFRHTVPFGVDAFFVYDDDPFSEKQVSVKFVWVL